MTAIDHELTGALIAVAVKQPWLAVPLAFASHFVMDALPHFNVLVIDGKIRERNANPLYKFVTRTDAALSIVGVVLLPIVLHNAANWWQVLLGILAALSPDFVWVYLHFKEQRSGIYGERHGLTKFHKSVQRLEYPWALPVDILWFAGGSILIGIIR